MNGKEYRIKAVALMSSGKSEEIYLSHYISDEDAEKIVAECIRTRCCEENSTIVETAAKPLFDEVERRVNERISEIVRETKSECWTYVWDTPEELWHRAYRCLEK